MVIFFAVCGPKFTRLCQQTRRDRTLQLCFPIVDILFRSGDIRDQSAKSSEIAWKKACFSAQILDLVFKIAPISDHVAKSLGDRLRDCGDFALNKKRKKKEERKKRRQNIRAAVALTQRAALIKSEKIEKI